jgi:HD-GYP domain-containing protein (c-di-GMP phosphodiesterase class II)
MTGAEFLVGEARKRRQQRMESRERTVSGVSAGLFVVVATLMAVLLPDERDPSPWLVVGLVLGYAAILQVRFEFGGGYASPENLAYVPLILLGPLPAVPLLVALAVILSGLPAVRRGTWHPDSLRWGLADAWIPVAPTVLLLLLAPGPLDTSHVGIYALAAGAHVAADGAWTFARNALLDHLPTLAVLNEWIGATRIDVSLMVLAFVIAIPSLHQPLYLLSILPLVWLFERFSIDRHERHTKALELQRAYRGTVMLLSDVVESEDSYTASHSRSVVELTNAVADELGVPEMDRQELEFAAMLHDVGKIAIPKEILNKPSRLTESEFELMKTHTIEGQFMLDRVGGLLGRVGEIVRSCHERWDGTGYPDGLRGEEIPLPSRIVFCCDAYNAMTTTRVYREALSHETAIAELRSNAGTQFDSVVVEALIRVVEHGKPHTGRTDEVRALLAGTRASRDLRAGVEAGS